RPGGNVAAERRGQAQRRFTRLDCCPFGEEAGAAGHGGAGQQAGADHLGDDENRRMLPLGDVRQSLNTPLGLEKRNRASKFELGERIEELLTTPSTPKT